MVALAYAGLGVEFGVEVAEFEVAGGALGGGNPQLVGGVCLFGLELGA